MLNRKKKKRDRVPRNSQVVLYCEREVLEVQRFHELRLSADCRSVYARWGRADRPGSRVNKRTRFSTKDEVWPLWIACGCSRLVLWLCLCKGDFVAERV